MTIDFDPRAPRLPLRASLQSAEGRRRYVRRLFATIADRYDLITRILSYGLDAGWKRRLVALAAPRRGELALDLACGTGDIAFRMAAAGARVAGVDVTRRMIEIARARRAGASAPGFVVGDMLSLPVADACCDVVTMGYGLRNAPVPEAALREIHRVLKPGGRMLSLDFNRPRRRLVRAVYLGYLTLVGSALGLALHGDADTYRYIPESIRRYPGAAGVAGMMEAAGFCEVRWVPLLGGLMAINLGSKPAS